MSAETASLFPDSLDPSPLGQAPKNWKVSTLETLYPANPEVVITGPFGSALHASDYREEGVPLVLVKNVLDGRIVEDDTPLVGTHKVIELERYRLQRGDIVFTRVGAVGRTALVQPRQEGWLISGQLLRVRLPQQGPIHSRYLAQLYREPRFIAVVEARALGTTRPSLNTKLVRQLPLPVPPMQIQAAFAKTLNPLDAARDTNELEMQTLSKLRDTLLPKLIAA